MPSIKSTRGQIVLINRVATEMPPGAIAFKYADPTEDQRWIYDEDELRAIEMDDPSLIVRAPMKLSDATEALETLVFMQGEGHEALDAVKDAAGRLDQIRALAASRSPETRLTKRGALLRLERIEGLARVE